MLHVANRRKIAIIIYVWKIHTTEENKTWIAKQSDQGLCCFSKKLLLAISEALDQLNICAGWSKASLIDRWLNLLVYDLIYQQLISDFIDKISILWKWEFEKQIINLKKFCNNVLVQFLLNFLLPTENLLIMLCIVLWKMKISNCWQNHSWLQVREAIEFLSIMYVWILQFYYSLNVLHTLDKKTTKKT